VNGTGQKQLTANVGNNSRPSVSPDGRYIVFASDRTGFNHIWRIDIDGSNARQLTNGNGEFNPECSPTGQWVVYQGWLSGKTGLSKVPIEGGETVLLVDKATGGVAISPDGNWIATAYWEPTYPALKSAIYPFEGGEPHQILDMDNSIIFDGRLMSVRLLYWMKAFKHQYPAGWWPTIATSDGVFSCLVT
jgi:dipeptidyl aminopeptidase/acylaminoacyl peptidase